MSRHLFNLKSEAIKRYYGDDVLKLPCSQYKMCQMNLFYPTTTVTVYMKVLLLLIETLLKLESGSEKLEYI